MRRPAAVVLLTLLAAGALLVPCRPAYAQVAGHPFGAGAHVGKPVGLSVKFYDRPGVAYDVLAAYDLDDDFFYVNAHRVQERPFQRLAEASARFFQGPGLLVGSESDDGGGLALGASYTAGLSLPFDRLEFSLQVTPRLRLLPDTAFNLGGGLGIRYYFSLSS